MDFVAFLSTFSLHFDIICLTEAHLYNKNKYLDTDKFHLEGYTSFKVHSSIKYGGCVVYVRNTLQGNMINDLTGTNQVSDYLYVNVTVPGSKKELCVAVYYRHNKHDKETLCNFTKELDNQLNSPVLKNMHLILMGDMNIDLSKLSLNDAIEMYYNTLLCHNLESHISYRVTGLYRLGKTCYLHSLLCNNSIIAQFPVQNDIISICTWENDNTANSHATSST